MKTIVAGSRSITNIDTVMQAIKDCPWKITQIVSGTASGVDQLGELCAEQLGIYVKQFPADWGTYGNSAGYIRNREMAKYADAVIIVYDGKSKGTKHMWDIALQMQLPVFVVDENVGTLSI